MTKYFSLEAIEWALSKLNDGCNGLFVDFLIVKREGLTPSTPISISTKSTAESASRVMGIRRSAGTEPKPNQAFFNPFVRSWRHVGYPRSGTYTSLERSNTFGPIVSVTHDMEGMRIQLVEGYIAGVKEKLRRNKATPLALSIEALSIWTFRYDQFPDEISKDSLTKRFLEGFNFSTEETDGFLVQKNDWPKNLFADTPISDDLLFGHLLKLSPINMPPPNKSTTTIQSAEEELPDDLIEFLKRDMLLPDALLRQLVTLLRAGKHLILTGPPGTGKSTLAARLAEASEKYAAEFAFPASSGSVFTTATADWSTFDTLGGYMPSTDGKGLVFQEGLFTKAIRENRWLVIDELNRADVDKAFGQLFTVLSGHNAVMPFRQNGVNVTLAFDRGQLESNFSGDRECYTIGRDWRIIATMNTFDRNLLFQLSAAFVRRFAVVHIGIPPTDKMIEWLEGRSLDHSDHLLVSKLMSVLSELRPLGPAIWLDMADYMSMRSVGSTYADADFASPEAAFIDAVTAYVLPQLDGLDQETLAVVQAQVQSLLTSEDDKARLSTAFKEMF